ncbi:Actin-related protein 4 [Paramarasmius palmivorus]|uniref:Actin-related protein 4 n=1 Tax=Paramarasmius palmivorus TaxID=297713 RepID=A0AAW0E5X3_9AGAR
MVTYGGDEVSALVLDIGSSTVRAGYAGDDSPKAIIPTDYGYIPTQSDGDITMNESGEGSENTNTQKGAKSFVGEAGPSLWRAGMHVGNPMNDGLIQDFGPIPALIRHALEDSMHVNPKEHPILVTEPAWNTPENRERMAEIMFEEFQVPAFYIANTGVLNSFAAGKGSALVIDIGQSVSSVIPVVDGFVLRKGVAYSPLPKLVQANARHILTNPNPARPSGIELYPHQLIATKIPVEPNAPPQFTLREDRVAGVTDSWRRWYEDREIDEWMQTVCGVLEQGWNDQIAHSRPAKQYEFPTGYNTYFSGHDRHSVGEQFFFHSPALMASNANLPRHIPALISDSIRACDPELRQVLMGNVVLTGGGSLFTGFADRLNNELSKYTHLETRPNVDLVGGWVAVFSQAWARSISYGSVAKNGRLASSFILMNAPLTFAAGARQKYRAPEM